VIGRASDHESAWLDKTLPPSFLQLKTTTNDDAKPKKQAATPRPIRAVRSDSGWFVLFGLYATVCLMSYSYIVCITNRTEHIKEQTTKTPKNTPQYYHKTHRKIVQHAIHTPKTYSKQKNKK
jgi:hypothetical protein